MIIIFKFIPNIGFCALKVVIKCLKLIKTNHSGLEQAALNFVDVNMVNDSEDPHGQWADLGCTYIVVLSPSVVIVLIPVQTGLI